MKKSIYHSISRLLLSISAILLSTGLFGCNDDVFIDPVETDRDTVTLQTPGEEMSVKVTGTDWRILDVHSGGDFNAGYDGGNIYFVDSPLIALSIEKKDDERLQFRLAYNITGEPYGFHVTVGNKYEERIINLIIAPTGKLEFKEIDYVLYSWGETPGEAYSDEIESYIFQGVDKSPYTFGPITTMPAVYQFIPHYSDYSEEEITNAICNLGVDVPIPSPSDSYPSWALLGDKASLTTDQSATMLSHFVKPQQSIEVPTGVPIQISRWCDYASYSFQCTITAYNPVTEKDITINAGLKILMPEKIYATYTLL